MAGYSSTLLVKKLGIKRGFTVMLINEPDNYTDLLEGLPGDVIFTKDSNRMSDIIQMFIEYVDGLDIELSRLKNLLHPGGCIWMSWRKTTREFKSPVSEDMIRNAALALGLVDVKVCAIDETWSALKLVVRKSG